MRNTRQVTPTILPAFDRNPTPQEIDLAIAHDKRDKEALAAIDRSNRSLDAIPRVPLEVPRAPAMEAPKHAPVTPPPIPAPTLSPVVQEVAPLSSAQIVVPAAPAPTSPTFHDPVQLGDQVLFQFTDNGERKARPAAVTRVGELGTLDLLISFRADDQHSSRMTGVVRGIPKHGDGDELAVDTWSRP